MTREEVRAWSEQEMQKTFDGKRWRFSRAAMGISDKAYSEGLDAGFALAVEIANASYNDYVGAFGKLDDDADPIVEMKCTKGRDAAHLWGDYQAKKKLQEAYELQVGDEFKMSFGAGVVVGMTPSTVHILWEDGSVGNRAKSQMVEAEKTGHRFDIAGMVERIGRERKDG